MSAKTSSFLASANSNSPKNSNNAAAAAAPTAVTIKKELPSDEIKDFAESTMNELLGWYGFDGVDRLDLSAKTSRLLQSEAALSSQQHHQRHQPHHQAHSLEKRRCRGSRSLLQMRHEATEQMHLLNNKNNNQNHNYDKNNSILGINNRKNSYRAGNDSATSDHDTRSSNDEDSKSPNSEEKTICAATQNAADKFDNENCCWCRRIVPDNAPEFLTTTDGPRYCSESCFTQSRRASFKKAKTCDWCKHIRHAVSYVDFQDGASQLQFCSDKCLNQYKMQIFCKETQAHLDMNPHLKEQGMEAASNGANLITPDLWLRNCRSRSASPSSTISLSPQPPTVISQSERPSISPPPITTTSSSSILQNTTSNHKPLISVAPVSKLMSKSPVGMQSRHSPKHNRKKRPVRTSAGGMAGGANRTELKTNSSSNMTTSYKTKSLLSSLSETGKHAAGLNQSATPSLTQFAASCVQDLHMSVPPLSPMLDSHSSQPTTPHSLPPAGRSSNNMPPGFFATPPSKQSGPATLPADSFPPRPPFLSNAGFLPRFYGDYTPHSAATAPPQIMQPTALNALIGTPPPVTLMVPYPVIIPLPIPIPVPLPIIDFYRAHLLPEERKKFDEERKLRMDASLAESCRLREKSSEQDESTDKPLDFRKTKNDSASSSSHNNVEEQIAASLLVADDLSHQTSKDCEKDILTNNKPANVTQVSQASPSKTPECSMETAGERSDDDQLNKSTSQFSTSSNLCNFTDDTHSQDESLQKLPKLKITRLQTKRTLTQTKESECSRPLRKRKRLINCDFQKFSSILKDNNEVDAADEEQQSKDLDRAPNIKK